MATAKKAAKKAPAKKAAAKKTAKKAPAAETAEAAEAPAEPAGDAAPAEKPAKRTRSRKTAARVAEVAANAKRLGDGVVRISVVGAHVDDDGLGLPVSEVEATPVGRSAEHSEPADVPMRTLRTACLRGTLSCEPRRDGAAAGPFSRPDRRGRSRGRRFGGAAMRRGSRCR